MAHELNHHVVDRYRVPWCPPLARERSAAETISVGFGEGAPFGQRGMDFGQCWRSWGGVLWCCITQSKSICALSVSLVGRSV